MYAGVYHYNLSSIPDITIRNELIHHIIRWFFISTITWKKQRSKSIILFHDIRTCAYLQWSYILKLFSVLNKKNANFILK